MMNGTSIVADLRPWTMFRQADPVVQAVMVLLAIAALLTWVILIAKLIEIRRTSGTLSRAIDVLGQHRTLATALDVRVLTDQRIPSAMLNAAKDEIAVSGTAAAAGGIKERIALRLGRVEAAGAREIGFGAGILGTIGATAPFVGLFGTVWGIMNSFVGIAQAKSTNLAVVAPGIAEALMATAVGLVAAIPAVVFHNHLARRIAAYRTQLRDTATLVTVLAGRELDARNGSEP